MSHTKTKAALVCIGRLPFTAFTVAEDTIRLAIFTVELIRKPNTTLLFDILLELCVQVTSEMICACVYRLTGTD